ncbi:hypothetical protein BVC80_1101g48 [Macleaya cordata]|uniref:2-phosphoglycerate kinase n=1 Tax=Macleaya cordata TaxID=56857 RepID=A0A200QCS8_MACCD|nr:hypothetical protein BVC80_1101g48 [Macleaya cordata]
MKKGKGVVVFDSNNPPARSGGGEEQEEDSSERKVVPPLPTGRLAARNASSKYDFVKVKVWLGDNADHYYVLSRFLLSRMLTVTKIPNHVAIKIALELKKLLIDNSLLDVSQSDLEANLFKLMERRGYGEEYINRYNMMTRLVFHHQRVPLVILVCGTACAGKSTIATQLAQRLNLPNVLQVNMLIKVLMSPNAPLVSTPVWARDFSSSEELITEFCRECRIVRKGSLAGDLKKAMKDGKPIIIEGIHLDPSIYLMDDENREPTSISANNEKPKPVRVRSEDNTTIEKESNSESTSESDTGSNNCCPEVIPEAGIPIDQLTEVLESFKSIDLARSASEDQGCVGEALEGPETKTNLPVKKEKSSAEPIIIPIVLKMAEFDHKIQSLRPGFA